MLTFQQAVARIRAIMDSECEDWDIVVQIDDILRDTEKEV